LKFGGTPDTSLLHPSVPRHPGWKSLLKDIKLLIIKTHYYNYRQTTKSHLYEVDFIHYVNQFGKIEDRSFSYLDSFCVGVPHVLEDVTGSGFLQLVLHPRVQLRKDGIILQKFSLNVFNVKFKIFSFSLKSLADYTESLHLKT
jgi:hypothetical protein